MKTKETKPITTAQIRKIHVLLQEQGLMNEKYRIVSIYSSGKAESTKDLTCHDAITIINKLESGEIKKFHESVEAWDYEKRKAVFRAIYGLAWKIDMIYGTTDEDYKMNIAKLNVFCRERGTVKKNLTEQGLTELRKTQRQFEAMYRKHDKKRKEVVNG